MEIHELNTFSGTLGSGDYFATDNGNDTSKVSAESMFAPLNARIDNIIAGPAPSAQEIIDARRGADGVTYPSLGDAMRDQVSDLKSELNQDYSYFDEILQDVITAHYGVNRFNKNSPYIKSATSVTTSYTETSLSASSVTHPIYVEDGKTYGFKLKKSYYGGNALVVCKCDRFGNLNGTGYIATESSGYGFFTADATGWVVVNVVTSEKASFMFVEGDTAPSNYVAFNDIYDKALSVYPLYINAANVVSAPYDDIDTLPNNDIVLYSNVSNSAAVANLPVYPFNGYIIPIRNEQAVGNFSTQIAVLISQTSQEVYFRNRFATWSKWSKLATSDSGSFNQNDNDAYMGLKNFTAVGDSITVGYSTPALNEYYIVRGWAEMLSHKIGVTFDKFATGGYGTADTIGASYYSTAIANSNNNEFAFLNLGINDLNHSLTIGTADSIGANDGTFIGNYSKIVSDLLTNHNFVLCGTIPQCLDDKVAREDYNDAIELVANYYSKAFVIDVAKWNDLFAPYALLGHLSSVGYGALTKAFILSINETMNNNSYFQTTIDRDNA